MWKLRTYRHTAAVIFAALYLFVALFSQNFHNHGSGEVFKDFNFKKSEKTYSKGYFAQEFSDCLSCHLLHDGYTLIPEGFALSTKKFVEFRQQIFAYKQRFSSLVFLNVQLRGPPANFI